MAKKICAAVVVVLAAVSLLPVLTCAAREMKEVSKNKGFIVQGRVFCETCRFGYETPLSTYMKDATVRVECRSKATGDKTCSFEGKTDASGTYRIPVADEHDSHEIDLCQVVLVSSNQEGCKTEKVQGRETARIFLAHNNGIASDTRYANSVGFLKDTALPECAPLKAIYKSYENDV